MPESVKESVDGIRAKVALIVEHRQMLARLLAESRAREAELQASVERLRAEVARLKAETEYLSVMRAVAPDREQVRRQRAVLTGLVREIDRCISELTAC